VTLSVDEKWIKKCSSSPKSFENDSPGSASVSLACGQDACVPRFTNQKGLL
jgi:hypothetical protein